IFARNERVICVFDTPFGPMAVILVGAMIVASIATTWHGQVTPEPKTPQTWRYQAQDIALDKGAEMGRFYLGSTAIVLMPKGVTHWQEGLVVGQPLKMGQPLAL
ncbi:MAG: phosphatidylserine decarboxylase, partial [Desulfobacteraceae bacterium]|nr:phosphatidylserine decarboxylase [Desulfobacteraceae bacterium]